jgi:hypothetical protein
MTQVGRIVFGPRTRPSASPVNDHERITRAILSGGVDDVMDVTIFGKHGLVERDGVERGSWHGLYYQANPDGTKPTKEHSI